MLIQGLINGIKSAAAAVYNTIASIGNSIEAKFQAVMDIHSPSREFRRFRWLYHSRFGHRYPSHGQSANRYYRHMGWPSKDSLRTVSVGYVLMSLRVYPVIVQISSRHGRLRPPPGGVTIHFNPTINAPGGDPAQIQTALQMGLREFETLFQRMMADRERGLSDVCNVGRCTV